VTQANTNTKPAKGRKKVAKPAAAKEAKTPRAESKGAKILVLSGRLTGATLAEITKATEWQAHSVRGFLSTTGKKRGLTIESAKNHAGAGIPDQEVGARFIRVRSSRCPRGWRLFCGDHCASPRLGIAPLYGWRVR